MPLGDSWASEPPPQSNSVISLDYWRAKALQFQETLNNVDRVYEAAAAIAYDATMPDEITAPLWDAIAEFNERKAMFRATAEAINLGASAINAAGGRFPVLSVPYNLSLPPLVLPAAAVAALTAAVSLVSWAVQWMNAVNQRLRTAQLLDAQATPEQRAALARSVAQSDAAIKESDSNSLNGLVTVGKWIAIAGGAFVLWQIVGPYIGKGRK